MRRQGAKFWTSRSQFINSEADGSSPVDILKSSECKKNHLQNVNPMTNEVTLRDNNNTNEKNKYAEVKSPTTSKRFSDIISAFRSPLVTPLVTPVSPDEVNNLFDVYARESKLNRAVSKDSGLDQSPENVAFNSSESSNCDQLPHDVGLDESGFSLDTSLSDQSPSVADLSPSIEEKKILWQNSPLSLMSPETEFNDVIVPGVEVQGTGEKTFEIGEILNPRSPFTLNLEGHVNFPLVQMVCREILMTERSYVNDLKEVIEGYIYHLKENCEEDDNYIFDIFGNLEDIYEFNKEVLAELEQCEVSESEIDPIKLANVFCEQTSGFNKYYTQYCTEYPEAASAFRFLLLDDSVAKYFSERQASIGHALSLESYLLKPVQRILKYNLLLKDILKKYEGDEAGYILINTALDAMSDVAEYINEMKRLHENALKVDEILDNLVDIDDEANRFDRYMTGKFVLENSFKVHGLRGDRTILILFEKMLIMCKKTEEKQLQYKDRMECSNMMLVESITKEPLVFQLLRFDNQKHTYTIAAKTLEIKKEWTQHIKRLILESHAAMIPKTARQAILGDEEAKSKYNSLPMQALDNTGMNTLRKPNLKGSKSPNVKDNAGVTTGTKRESNEKESSKEAKRHLRPKDFLAEIKARSNVTSPTSTGTTTTLPEKEKKEKWWIRHKHKPSLDSVLNTETTPEKLDNNNCTAEELRKKSRSLESLQDVFKMNDDVETKGKDNLANTTDNSECSCETEATLKTNNNNNNTRNRSKSAITGPVNYLKNESIDSNTECNIMEEVIENCNTDNGEMSDEIPSPTIKATNQDEMNGHITALKSELSSLGENNSPSQIRNLVNKMTNVFHSSSPKTSTSAHPSNGVSPMFFSPLQNNKKYRKGTETTNKHNTDNFVENSTMELIDSEVPLCTKKEDIATLSTITSESQSVMSTSVDDQHPTIDDDGEVFETDDAFETDDLWSTNVDALLNEVNADLHSIAGSIASDTAKSNGSDGSDVNMTPTDSSTSIGIDMSGENKSELNRDETECNESLAPTENVVQVKQVADRIKEYKRLVDSEKRRLSWIQREPRDISEMIESLDSIQSVDTALSPTYSSLRRRFRPSRDYGARGDARSSLDHNESSRVISPLREGSVDSFRSETPIVELNAKSGELVSQTTTPNSTTILPATLENVHQNISVEKSKRTSSSYEYVETVPKTPEAVSTATIISSSTPKEGHVLSEQIALDHVFYTNEDERRSKANSLPSVVDINESYEKLPRKTSDTTHVKETKDRTEKNKEFQNNLSTYSNLLTEAENVAKRSEFCFKALKNLEQHKRKPHIQKPKTPTFTTSDMQSLLNSNFTYNEKNENTAHARDGVGCNGVTTTQMSTYSNKMESGEKLSRVSITNNEPLVERLSGDSCTEQRISHPNSDHKETKYEKNDDNSIACREKNNENARRSEDIKVCQAKNEEAKPYQEKNVEGKPCQGKKEEAKPCQRKKEEAKPFREQNEEAKPCQRKKEEAKPCQDKNVEAKPCREQNEEGKPCRVKNEEAKPWREKNEEAKPCRVKNEEAKPWREKNEEAKPCQETNEKSHDCKDSSQKETPTYARSNNKDKPKVVRMGKDGGKKVFRISKDGSINEKKVFDHDKNKEHDDVGEENKSRPLSDGDKTLICRLDIVEKSKVGSRDEKQSPCDKVRPLRQDSNDKSEINCEKSNSTSNSSSNCPSLHGDGVRSRSVTDLRERRSKSMSGAPSKGFEHSLRCENTFTTETFINLDNRSLTKSNSSPPEPVRASSLDNDKYDDSRVIDNVNNNNKKIKKITKKKKAPDIPSRPPLVAKKVTRSISMPSVNGVPSDPKSKEKSNLQQEQIIQLKSKLDSCAVDETQRGRSGAVRHLKSSKNCTEKNTAYPRSTSLPRRKTNFLIIPNENIDESNKSEKYVLRSPSIRNIQQNHVNNRIKDYFVNLQKSSEVSRSRPNLLLIDSSGSDSESSTDENNSNLPLTDTSDDSVQIYRGTVRSMIKKYGQVNFVFD